MEDKEENRILCQGGKVLIKLSIDSFWKTVEINECKNSNDIANNSYDLNTTNHWKDNMSGFAD